MTTDGYSDVLGEMRRGQIFREPIGPADDMMTRWRKHVERLERDREALLAAAKECRDALTWIQNRIDNGDEIVMERGWNEEIGQANRAITQAEKS